MSFVDGESGDSRDFEREKILVGGIVLDVFKKEAGDKSGYFAKVNLFLKGENLDRSIYPVQIVVEVPVSEHYFRWYHNGTKYNNLNTRSKLEMSAVSLS